MLIPKLIPVTEETTEHSYAILSCHRRNNIAFISCSQGDCDAQEKAKSRNHILYHCQTVLGTLKRNEELTVDEVAMRNNKLATILVQNSFL